MSTPATPLKVIGSPARRQVARIGTAVGSCGATAAAYGSCISQNATQIHGKGHCQKEFELFRECVRKSLVSRS